MGSNQVLAALLHRARAALRLDGSGVLAGHGVADNAYRPPYLPYASVIGPLAVETEPERGTATQIVRVRNPGYLAGVSRDAFDIVPGPGALGLLFDDSARGTVPIDPGPLTGAAMTAGETGRDLAAVLQAAVRSGVDNGLFVESGAPVTDPVRRAELRAATVRWDPALLRLVVSSGRRGPLSGELEPGVVSQVAAVPLGAGDVGPALGLGADAGSRPGAVTRSRDTAPTAVAVDVRLDLWAGTQAELATLVDGWYAVTPTRAELLLAPTPLAADVAPGDTTVRLLFDALPQTRATLLAATAADGLADRVTGRAPGLADGATVTPTGVRLAGAAVATYPVLPVPAIAEAWHPRPAGARGWAVGLRLRVAAAAADGDAGQVFRLGYGPAVALRLRLSRDGADYRLEGTAEHADGASFAAASTAVSLATLESGNPVDIHVLVDGAAGAVRVVAAGGRPLASGAAAPGPTASGVDEDVTLVLGDPAGSDLTLEVAEVQVYGRPLGPADSRLRRPGPAAAVWTPGDPLVLSSSADGFASAGAGFHGYVVGVEGDVVRLDRPVTEAHRRGGTLAHQGRLFMAQRQLRRNDDLMNRIYRVALEYRVSTFLDDTRAAVTAPLVERPEVEVRELVRLLAEQAGPPVPSAPPTRPAPATVGVHAVITDSITTSPTITEL